MLWLHFASTAIALDARAEEAPVINPSTNVKLVQPFPTPSDCVVGEDVEFVYRSLWTLRIIPYSVSGKVTGDGCDIDGRGSYATSWMSHFKSITSLRKACSANVGKKVNLVSAISDIPFKYIVKSASPLGCGFSVVKENGEPSADSDKISIVPYTDIVSIEETD